MVDENISLELDIGDCSAIMGHNFIEQIGIWCAVEASNDLPLTGLSAFDIKLCKRSFQLFALASLIATFASRQASIHPCRF